MKEAVMSVWALMIGLFLGFAGIGTQMIGVSADPADQALVAGGNGQVRTMEDPFGPPPPR
jgi:hypothetical protein